MTIPMPEPVAWITNESLYGLKAGRTNSKGAVPVHASRSYVAKTPLITTTQAEAYAAAKVREAQRWHPIDSAPHETLVVLGWYDESGVFKQEIGLASAGRRYPGGASDMWWHGRATHWMPLPAPPQQ